MPDVLTSSDALKDKRVEVVLEQLEELPTLPAVAVRVLEVTGEDEGSAKRVVELISSDPSLTARILKLVHRADLGVRAEVNSVERAVVLLGFEAVRAAVLAVSMFETFPPPHQPPHQPSQQGSSSTPAGSGGRAGAAAFTREGFWRHSIAVGACAELLAKELKGPAAKEVGGGGGEAFLCGLLHDIGKVALDAALPKSFAKVIEATELVRGNLADVERQVVGIDHMVVGKRLCERWKLPSVVRDCVWLHGQMPGALPRSVARPRLVNLVTLADVLVREQHLGYSGNYAFPVPRAALLEAVGVSEEQVSRVMAGLVEAIEARAGALGIGEASTGEMYRQALAAANKELGRVSVQLAARNKRLAVRAKFFDSLAEFHGALRADAPPGLVLRAIAETAQEALGAVAVAAFSVPPGQGYAEIVVCEGDREPETVVAECGTRPVWGGGAGGVAPADGRLEFAMGAVSPRLGGGKRWWTGLVAEGECVGGVIWASKGEGDEEEVERLRASKVELAGLSGGWSLALRTAQIRDEARTLAEQLAEANRNLQDAQGELLRAKTLVTIAEMAAGAAHEMNNPLAVISGRSQLLASTLTDELPKKSAKLIAEQTERLSGMITELMEFAKPVPPVMGAVDVASAVARAVEGAKARPGQSGRAVAVGATDVPAVRGDSGQVAGALTEIIDNALQATDAERGKVEVSAAHDPVGGTVVVTVADDGCGMDETVQRRAFDPFYSFKPAGRRRGMGLARALRWVEAMGGQIRLESRPGAGTRVTVLLPVDVG